MRQLTLDELADGRLKALQNAADLLEDAQCLLKQKRWARCAFLSHIAVEELGKYLMIIGAIGNLIAGEIDWRKFWRRFVSHPKKAGNIYFFNAALSPSKKDEEILRDFAKAETDAKASQEEKLSSLYVDFQSNGFVLPMDIISKETAKTSLERAKAALSFFQLRENEVFSKADFGKLSPSMLEKIKGQVRELSAKLDRA